jgi:FkbM family methyltransferase
VAVDIGAHCGTWAMQLEKKFARVHCFEPIERHRECLALNAQNSLIYPYALGHKDGTVRLQKGVKSTGDTQIAPDGEYESEIRRLDSFDLKDVDFVKIDAEGYELFILQGGEKLVDTYKPPMIVEQKPGKGKFYGLGDTDAVKWLEKKGYKVREVIAGDYIVAA